MSQRPLTVKQRAIVDALERGPQTMSDLLYACGYDEGSRAGRTYVTVALTRLTGRGYGFSNMRPPGSHRGGLYVLMTRPRELAPEPATPAHCESCGVRLARDHREDRYCSPCQRSLLEVELAFLAPPTLLECMVAS
jgi:hypothetical protein